MSTSTETPIAPGVRMIDDAILRFTYALHGQPLDWPAIFGREAPMELEIGTSGGEFLSRRARDQPDVDHVGVEVKNRRVRAFAGRIRKQGLSNCRVVHADISLLIGCLFWPGTLSRVYVLFPDPWPKKRHHKNRVINAYTMRIFADLIRPGGELVLATDHLDYRGWMREVVGASPDFTGPVYDASTSPYGFATRYETYWIAERRSIRYLIYRRR